LKAAWIGETGQVRILQVKEATASSRPRRIPAVFPTWRAPTMPTTRLSLRSR
jgi:hypothetical protein